MLGRYLKKAARFQQSIIGKIVAIYIVIFVMMLAPVFILTYTSFTHASAYESIINNVDSANQLNTIVKTRIESVVWDIVAGKVTFEDSNILHIITDIRMRMNDISLRTYSPENAAIMGVALRTLNTLENYVWLLQEQIAAERPVAENEAVLEEIRGVVALIDDLLRQFSSEQIAQVALLNEEMARRSAANLYLSVFLIVVVAVAGVFSFLYISKSMMTPIENLRLMSGRIAGGEFGFRAAPQPVEEFNELAESMNIMAAQIELLLDASIEEQKQLQMAEMKALQAQITPHFLYNTLDAIIWAAEAKNTGEVIQLVSSLSSFFRISLSHGIDFIPIADELAHVRSYLDITQTRYSDILTYEIQVEEALADEVRSMKMLKLLLQPLVENALYHGVKNTRGRGKITVSVREHGDGVLFTVRDTGLGMTPEALAELRRGLAGGERAGKGYGLFNVNRRLQLYYDMRDGVRIESEYRGGTSVSFVLPRQVLED